MTYPTWPAELPQKVQREGFGRQIQDGRLKSPTDMGPGKVRRKFSAAVRTVTAQIWMSREQLQIFDDFWQTDTKGGSLPFWFPEPGRHGFPMRDLAGNVLLGGDGTPLLISSIVLVMFSPDAEPPRDASTSDTLWPVTLNLDILP